MFFKNILIFLTLCISCISISCASTVSDFTLQDLEEQTVSLSDYKGKVVFIDFWASWCPPCRQSIPVVENLYEEYKNNDKFVVLGINLNEDKSTILEFIKQQQIKYKVLMGDKTVASNYKIRGIPAFFVIDKNGKIYNKYVGYAPGSESQWKEDIKKLLE